ncbi:MAG: OmpW family outer membrane protein [Pseudomonadales bacterium]|jgi:outer membrane protein
MRALKLAALGAAVAITGANAAFATEAGDWLVRAGVTDVVPKSNNGTIPADGESPAIAVDVDDAVMLTFDGTYMVTDNFGVELLAALPFKHDVYGKAAGEKVKLATVKQLPPTLSGVYRFNSQGTIQPYVGAGINWTLFFDEQEKGPLDDPSVNLKLDNSVGLAAVAGLDVFLTKTMFLNANVRYMDIDSKVKVNGEKVLTAKVDPWIYAINIGWQF